MGNFVIKNQTNNVQYEYSNDTMMVQGNYAKDATKNTLQSIVGSCYRKNGQGQQGEFFGNFNGYMRDGGVKYSVSEMSRTDATAVWSAIDEIEPHITDNDNGGGEE